MYAQLFDWTQAYRFDTEREEYWTHITTGTHVAQICLFLLVESRAVFRACWRRLRPEAPAGNNQQHCADPPGSLALRRDCPALWRRAARRGAVLENGIATRNARFNGLIDEVERVAVRSRAPSCSPGPTGASKSHLARRMFELKKARHPVAGEFVEVNCATLRGDGRHPDPCSGHKGAPSPARRLTSPACCVRRTRVCCSSTEMGSWALDGTRPCCSNCGGEKALPHGQRP